MDEIVERIRRGGVFIHPTDTIYGLGTNAENEKGVRKIRKLKQQFSKPLSVWAPSLSWVEKNCVLNPEARAWLGKLPGPYTLVLKIKKPFLKEPFSGEKMVGRAGEKTGGEDGGVCNSVSLGADTIGVRLPVHWFRKVVEKSGVPIVTTSANLTNRPFMTSLKDLDAEIEKGVEFMVYEGEKAARPSTIINVAEGKIRER